MTISHALRAAPKQRFEKAVELLSIINPGDSLISLEKKTAEKFMRKL